MTKELIPHIITARLIKDEPDVVRDLLSPLLLKKPVWLVVEDKRLPKKTRKYSTALCIQYASDNNDWLLVAMPPYGAELIDLRVDLKPIVFVRVGLSVSLSTALVNSLKRILRR